MELQSKHKREYEMEVQVNLWAVLLAMASSMVVGSVWYAQSVFGKTWMKLAKVNPNGDNMAKLLGATAVLALVTAYVLAHVTALSNNFFPDNSYLQNALTTAFWVWLGFTASRVVTHDMYEGRPSKLSLLTIGNEFVTLMVMGLVIGLFGPAS